MTLDEILELKREKEFECAELRAEIRALARVEERLVRLRELQKRVTAADLELLNFAPGAVSKQVVSVPGIESTEYLGII